MQGPSRASTGQPCTLRLPCLALQVTDLDEDFVDGGLAAALHHNAHLTQLECETTRIIPHLAPLTALRELALKHASAAELSIQDLEQLMVLSALRHLRFGRTLYDVAVRRRRLKVQGGVGRWLAGLQAWLMSKSARADQRCMLLYSR